MEVTIFLEVPKDTKYAIYKWRVLIVKYDLYRKIRKKILKKFARKLNIGNPK